MGIASRRGADRLIQEGRIVVNKKIVKEMGRQINLKKDIVEIDGKLISTNEEKKYWIVNKPKGVVSTTKDPQGRKVITSLVKTKTRLYPVGRLDSESQGLILLTNDGDLAYKLTHPKYEVEKVYQVKVEGKVTENKLDKLRKGVWLTDGLTAKAKVEFKGWQKFEIVIHEGRNRQVRRMCSKVGLEVLELKRIKMGSLELGNLAEGKSRKLTNEEILLLKEKVVD